MSSNKGQKKREYLRKLDVRIRRWVRITLPDSSGEYQEKMIEDLLQEGEKLYDDVCTILNNKDV